VRRQSELHDRCRTILGERWESIQLVDITQEIVPELASDIHRVLRAPMGISATFRFVLPTQLVAKLADPALDCRALQALEGENGSFNARDVAKHVIVPFNRDNGSPLGASGDPYVNNPVRLPRLSTEFRPQQKDKALWDILCRITDDIELVAKPEYTGRILDQVLLEMRRRIEQLTVAYAVPGRISHSVLIKHLEEFLAPRTGGRRIQAVCISVFRTVGEHWGVYDRVDSGVATAADAAGRRAADIECTKNGKIVLAVEVKDVTLSLQLLEDKIRSSRLAHVWELLFLIRADPIANDSSVHEAAEREFAAGQNVYLLPFDDFISAVLMWLGGPGRHAFTENVGKILDEFGHDYTDRRAWADILNRW